MALCRYPFCDTFKCAVAGAPVTSWDGYDTHYTGKTPFVCVCVCVCGVVWCGVCVCVCVCVCVWCGVCVVWMCMCMCTCVVWCMCVCVCV